MNMYVRKDLFEVYMQNINSNFEKVFTRLDRIDENMNDIKKSTLVWFSLLFLAAIILGSLLGLGLSAAVGAGVCTGEETGARASTTGFPSSAGL